MKRWLTLLGVVVTLMSVSADAKLVVRESTLTATFDANEDNVAVLFIVQCYIDTRLTWQAFNAVNISPDQTTVTVEKPSLRGAEGACYADMEVVRDPAGTGISADYVIGEEVRRIPLNQ